jgi:hypothetical protein
LAGERCWALIAAAPDSAAVRGIWQQIEDDASPDLLMYRLLRMGLRESPDLALLAARDGRSHLICRGRGSATLITNGMAECLAGTGLVSWREHLVPPDVTCVVLGDPPASTDLQLPASAGVFLAQSVTVALTAASDRRPAAPHAAGSPLAGSAADEPVPAAEIPPLAPDGTGQEGPGPGTGEEAGYDYLFGATQARTIEGAAVRPAVDDGEAPELPAAEVPVTELPLPAPRAELPAGPAGPPPAGPPPAGLAGPQITPGVLIEAVPWVTGTAGMGPGPAVGPEDDNGATIRREDLRRAVHRAAFSDRIGPTVHALLCPDSHASPPSSSVCRVCAAPLPQRSPVTVPRPVLGVLRLSTGDAITLDRGVVMGRAPRTDFEGDERPHVVKLPSGDGGISRTHLQVSLDGWHVLVTDLKSTNGTLAELPGRAAERLRPGEPFPIQPGTLVTLADDTYFRYEAAP